MRMFPYLPGLTWDIKLSPTWSTVVQKARTRTTTRLMNDAFPLWTFELSYEFLRGGRSGVGSASAANPANYSEVDLILGFYNACGGSFADFMLDPALLTGSREDGHANCTIGTGDGVTTAFQLVRNQGGFHDEVQNPVGPVQIFVNGAAATTGWTQGPAGQIVFAAAPALNASITAVFQWRWRVRFAEDSLGLQGFMFQLYELQSLKLEQARL